MQDTKKNCYVNLWVEGYQDFKPDMIIPDSLLRLWNKNTGEGFILKNVLDCWVVYDYFEINCLFDNDFKSNCEKFIVDKIKLMKK